MYRFIVVCFLAMVISGSLNAQKTMVYSDPDARYSKAIDLFDKEQYAASQQIFIELQSEIADPGSPMRVQSEFYTAACAYHLLNRNARSLLFDFIAMHPESNRIPMAWFYLGNTWYRENNYSKAIEAYANVESKVLDEDDLAEFHFKSGYAYFMKEDYTSARAHFMEIKDKDTRYTRPAIYYYSHIAYLEKTYEVALQGFQSLLTDETFGPVAPYYVAQIYYLQGKYEDVLAFAPPMLSNPNVKRQAELSRIVGESYYHQLSYADAIPYLEKYIETTSEPVTRTDHYQLGYAYYATGKWGDAVKHLQEVTGEKDSLAQNAYYHLAGAYLKIGNRKYALESFNQAYQLKFNPLITEDALFNYAKLSYELDFNPYNNAIRALKTYINDYPTALRSEEAKELLANLLMTTNNFKDAIVILEQIRQKNDQLWLAYQKVCLYHGIELFNDSKFDDAIALFSKAISFVYDRKIRAQALYWKGDAYYRKGNNDSAYFYYDAFVKYPASEQLPIYNLGWYSLGYTQMANKEYSRAQESFKRFTKDAKSEDPKIISDAYLRLGDCFYKQKSYADAIVNYDKVIELNRENQDYALYQKAVCQGVQSNFKGKIATLNSLMERFPNSGFMDDALFQLGHSYEVADDPMQSLATYNRLISDFPESNYIPKAMLKKGLLFRNAREDDQALSVFKELFSNFQGTEESRQALVNIENIYTENDRLDDFFSWIQSINGPSISESKQDSLVYLAAENNYMNGDCEAAIKGFNQYIGKYPNGFFISNAQFYRSECLYASKRNDEAISGYEYILSLPFSRFSESSALKAARIYFIRKDYPNAILKYTYLESIAEYPSSKIEAKLAIMRSHFEAGSYNEAILAAQNVISASDMPSENVQEARATLARSAFALENFVLAKSEFEKLATVQQAELGAEASYYLALIEFKEGKYPEAEKRVFDLINVFASYEYWVAKSFILLADVNVATGNLFQAKQSLQGVIEHYQGQEIVDEARQKLQEIEQTERLQEQQNNGTNETIVNPDNQ